jgi:hypothetical protein
MKNCTKVIRKCVLIRSLFYLYARASKELFLCNRWYYGGWRTGTTPCSHNKKAPPSPLQYTCVKHIDIPCFNKTFPCCGASLCKFCSVRMSFMRVNDVFISMKNHDFRDFLTMMRWWYVTHRF